MEVVDGFIVTKATWLTPMTIPIERREFQYGKKYTPNGGYQWWKFHRLSESLDWEPMTIQIRVKIYPKWRLSMVTLWLSLRSLLIESLWLSQLRNEGSNWGCLGDKDPPIYCAVSTSTSTLLGDDNRLPMCGYCELAFVTASCKYVSDCFPEVRTMESSVQHLERRLFHTSLFI